MITPVERRVALLIACCFFMEIFDGTIVTTAAPAIAASLHTPPTSIALVITAYLLTVGALIPVSGWLSARCEPRRVLCCAIGVFTIGSGLCAASGSVTALIAARVLQGLGGAMMVPVGRQIVFGQAAKRDILRLTSYVVWPALLAPVFAPAVGGWIVTYTSWRWIFLINLPIGVVALAIARRVVPRGAKDPTARLDVLGTLLTCLGLALVMATAQLIADRRSTPLVTAGAALSIGVGLARARHLRRSKTPLINIKVLRIRTFRLSQTGGFSYLVVIGGTPFLLSLLFQECLGWTPGRAGAVLLWVFAGNVAAKPFTTGLIRRFGFRAVLVVSSTFLTVVTAGLSLVADSLSMVPVCGLLFLAGVFRSVGLAVYTTLALGDVPPDLMRAGNVFMAASQQVAAGLGVALASLLLRAGASVGAHVDGRSGYAVGAYEFSFITLGAIAALCAVQAFRLPNDAGRHLLARDGSHSARNVPSRQSTPVE